MGKSAVTAKPSKRSLQEGQEKLREIKHDSLSSEPLQTQYNTYGLLLAVACYCIMGLHRYSGCRL